MKEYLYKPLDYLNLDKFTSEKLKQNNIHKIKDLCILNRKDLKALSFKDTEIYHIRIKMQLIGLDLNKKCN